MAGYGKNSRGETCTQAYDRNRKEINEKIENLMSRLEATSVDGDKANWANVGSAEHIKELLDEVLQFVG